MSVCACEGTADWIIRHRVFQLSLI